MRAVIFGLCTLQEFRAIVENFHPVNQFKMDDIKGTQHERTLNVRVHPVCMFWYFLKGKTRTAYYL